MVHRHRPSTLVGMASWPKQYGLGRTRKVIRVTIVLYSRNHIPDSGARDMTCRPSATAALQHAWYRTQQPSLLVVFG